VNNDEGQDRIAAPTSGDGVSNGPRHRAPDHGTSREPLTSRPPIRPDDRVTAILPPVTDSPKVSDLRDPVAEVKAALDGDPKTARMSASPPSPPSRTSPPGDPGDREDSGSGDGREPSRLRRYLPDWPLRRWLAAAAAVFIVLPILTFGLAYLIGAD
jgi:hypothetical protein